MGIFGDLLGYQNIEIVSPYPIWQLSEFKIVRQLNCHTKLYYTGIIPEAKMDSYIQDAAAKDTIVVKCKNSAGKAETLFQGLVAEIGVKAVNGVYYLEVQGLSHTAELDVKLQDRSFQNKDLKYSDLLNQIMQAYSGGRIQDTASQGKTLGQFTLQRGETDWRVFKRLASRVNTFLVPDDTVAKPEVSFGLPQTGGEAINLSESLPYRTGKDFPGRAEWSDGDFQTDDDCAFYAVEAGQAYPLGSRVKFKGIELIVVQVIAELKDGHLHFSYLLYPRSGLKQKTFWNPKLAGAALQGKVIEVDQDRVRVHLDIDQQQDQSTALWFPYASFYTAEGNSGFYCMPQLGDQVQVYFPSAREEEAIATTSIRKDKNSSKVQDPSIKYFGTNQGKELKLAGGELLLTAKDKKEGRILIKLNDETGVEIRSDNEIYLASRQKFSFVLDQKATIKAKEEIQLICGETSINMDGITHIKGVEVDLESR